MRAAILTTSLLPYLWYAWKDNAFHFHGRKVSLTEHLLHAAIGVSLAIMFGHAVAGNHGVVLGALVLFGIGGAIDEYIFHRDLPAVESDLHAKEHLALLIFVVISLATDWLQKNNWDVTAALSHLRAVRGAP